MCFPTRLHLRLLMIPPASPRPLLHTLPQIHKTNKKCVDEVVATATESRALSAFLACGNHRSPAVRAKSAMATLLCVRRRCHAASTARSGAASSRTSKGERCGGGGGGGRGGSVGVREMDRLLSALPRFLQVHTYAQMPLPGGGGGTFHRRVCMGGVSGDGLMVEWV